jgi:hypothetical protein
MKDTRSSKSAILTGVAVLTIFITAGSAFTQKDARPLAPIEKRVLSGTITTRGIARLGLPRPVVMATSGLKVNKGVVTTLAAPNTELKEGSVILTASGRPLFVLQGAVPAYRDLGLGISGKDVLQLEEALARMGFKPGRIDGTYDGQTGAAVAEWYKSGGWEPFGPTATELANIQGLEESLATATKEKLAAKGAAAAAALAVEAAHATARHNNQVAADALAAKLIERESFVPSSQGGVPVAVESARAKANYANQVAKSEVATKIWERALVVMDPKQTRTARMAAEAKVELARAAALNTQLDGELAVQAAEKTAKLAARQYELAEAAVKVARLDSKLAVKRAEDAQQVADLDAKLAAEKSNRATARLELARSRLGVQVPADEIAFLPSLPVRVDQATVLVGDAASGPVVTVTDPLPAVESSLPLGVARHVKRGMEVAISDPDRGIKLKGTVEEVADAPGTQGVDRDQVFFKVRVAEKPAQLEGLSLRLTIPVKTSEAVLAVPLEAISLTDEGQPRVQVRNDKGELEYVAVQRGLSADGFVEVTPIAGTLKQGQSVVVETKKKEK